jgi:hypothetical protein
MIEGIWVGKGGGPVLDAVRRGDCWPEAKSDRMGKGGGQPTMPSTAPVRLCQPYDQRNMG